MTNQINEEDIKKFSDALMSAYPSIEEMGEAFESLRKTFANVADEILSIAKVGIRVIEKEVENQYLATLPWWRRNLWPWLTKREKQKAIWWALND